MHKAALKANKIEYLYYYAASPNIEFLHRLAGLLNHIELTSVVLAEEWSQPAL